MPSNIVETTIVRVENHITFEQWGASHDELQAALDEARDRYSELTTGMKGGPVPNGAIRVAPGNGEVVVVFTVENPKSR